MTIPAAVDQLLLPEMGGIRGRTARTPSSRPRLRIEFQEENGPDNSDASEVLSKRWLCRFRSHVTHDEKFE